MHSNTLTSLKFSKLGKIAELINSSNNKSLFNSKIGYYILYKKIAKNNSQLNLKEFTRGLEIIAKDFYPDDPSFKSLTRITQIVDEKL